jgi:hypothetical protein
LYYNPVETRTFGLPHLSPSSPEQKRDPDRLMPCTPLSLKAGVAAGMFRYVMMDQTLGG